MKAYRVDDIEPVKEIMREVILSRFPMKPGRVLLDKLVSDRKVYSLNEATTATQMHQRKFRNLLAQHPAADDIRSGMISAEVINETLEIVPRLLNGVQARDRLALSTSQFTAFRRHELIKPAFGLEWDFDKDEIDAFIADLASHAQPVRVPPPFTTDLVDTIRARHSIVRLIEHIKAEKLDTILYVDSDKGLRKIWLDPSEVRRKLHPRKFSNRRTL